MIKLLCFKEHYKPTDIPDFTIWLQVVNRFSEDYKNKVTKRRVEFGYEVSDNSTNEPSIISIGGAFGDIVRNPNFPIFGLYTIPIIGSMLNQNVIDEVRRNLDRVRNEKMFVVIYNTKNGKFYENYMITSLSIKDTPKSSIGFEYSIVLQEVKMSVLEEMLVWVDGSPATDGNKGQGNLDSSVSDSTKNRTSMALDGFRAVGKAVGSLGG